MKEFLVRLTHALAGPPEPDLEWPGDDAPFWKRLLFFLAGGENR